MDEFSAFNTEFKFTQSVLLKLFTITEITCYTHYTCHSTNLKTMITCKKIIINLERFFQKWCVQITIAVIRKKMLLNFMLSIVKWDKERLYHRIFFWMNEIHWYRYLISIYEFEDHILNKYRKKKQILFKKNRNEWIKFAVRIDLIRSEIFGKFWCVVCTCCADSNQQHKFLRMS